MNQQQCMSQPLMDMMTALHPCHPHIRLGPKEQNNSVTVGFERRPEGDEILRTALTHREQLGRRRELGKPGWNPEDQQRLAFCTGLGCARRPGQVQSFKDKPPNVFQWEARKSKFRVRVKSGPTGRSCRAKSRAGSISPEDRLGSYDFSWFLWAWGYLSSPVNCE